MAVTVGDLVAKLRMDSREFDQGVTKATNALGRMDKGFRTLAVGAARISAGVAAVATIAEFGEIQATALTAHPVGYFSGGFIEWVDPDRGIERRAIESHLAGGVIKLFGSADGTSVGMSFTAYPGCARTTTACNSFNNIGNYGGIPNLDGKSPFDGNPVFV